MSEKEKKENIEYFNLKMMEMYEPNEDSRKEISKMIKTMEKDHQLNKISQMNDMFENQVEENLEITGGKTK